jgi:DNA repair protein RecO
MSRHSTCHALILRTTDIGEADRFCILLTRERGRLAARAGGVRKTGSRMSGHLLAPSLAAVELQESSSGFRIVGARPLDVDGITAYDVAAFVHAQQGMEFLLKLLQDNEPVPEIFDLAARFLTLCASGGPSPVIPFGLRLLALLGLLPLSDDHPGFRSLPASSKDAVRRCAADDDMGELSDGAAESFLYGVLGEHVATPLKARVVARAM